MEQLARESGGTGRAMGEQGLKNKLMQMRKVCNHPDLLTAPFTGECAARRPQDRGAWSVGMLGPG